MLGSTPILPLLAKMAIPATIAMSVNALYNVVDAIFIGRGVGSLAIGGLSIAFPIQMVVVAIALMVGIGGASIISRALGANDPVRAARVIGTGLFLILALSATLVVVSLLATDEILTLFGATRELLGFAREYLTTVIFGAPFMAIAIAANHLVRSEGRAEFSMVIVVLGALLNIALDPLFIFVFEMGIRGAALATVIAQFCSFVLVLIFYLKPLTSLKLRAIHLIPEPAMLWEIVTLGLPAFVRQFGGSFFVIITNNALKSYGSDLHISVFGIVTRVLIFAFMPLIGIAQGLQPIVGYNFGARNLSRVREAVKKTNLVSVGISLCFFTIVMLFPEPLLMLFSSDRALIEIGRDPLRIVLLAIPFIGLQMVGAVYFQAIGRAIPALVLSMTRQVLFLVPLVLLLPRAFGITGVWAAFPAADVTATVVTLTWLGIAMNRLSDSIRGA